MLVWLTLIIACRDKPNFKVMTRQQCAQNVLDTVHLLDILMIYGHDEICFNANKRDCVCRLADMNVIFLEGKKVAILKLC